MKTHESWWVINGADFQQALRRVDLGEDPDIIYMEYYVNSAHEKPMEGEDE